MAKKFKSVKKERENQGDKCKFR